MQNQKYLNHKMSICFLQQLKFLNIGHFPINSFKFQLNAHLQYIFCFLRLWLSSHCKVQALLFQPFTLLSALSHETNQLTFPSDNTPGDAMLVSGFIGLRHSRGSLQLSVTSSKGTSSLLLSTGTRHIHSIHTYIQTSICIK